MSHPDGAKLIEYAAGGSSDTALAGHINECTACATEVGKLRSALEGLRVISFEGDTTGPGCLDEHGVGALAGGELAMTEREAALAHLGQCAHCRRAVASVASALGSEDVRGALVDPARPSRSRWVRFAVPLGAAAALALLLVPSAPSVDSPTHRSPATTSGAPVAIAPTGLTSAVRSLRWHAVAGADRYRVTLFDEDGTVLWESTLPDTVISVPTGVPLAPGRPYYWIVAARIGFDRWETSALVAFSIAAGIER